MLGQKFGRLTFLLSVCFQASVFAQDLELKLASPPEGLSTVEFFSPAVGRMMKFDIVLPPDYAESVERYPVLYLLHGYLQNYTVWGRSLSAAYYARKLNDLILVLPDGGNSWYINYAFSEQGQTNNWEDHIIEDVVGYVDEHYRTEARRQGRALSGLSMGGFGALALGLRHPDQFISIGSTSGALSFARAQAARLTVGAMENPRTVEEENSARFAQADASIADLIAIPGFSTQQERNPKGRAFSTPEQARAYDPFSIIYKVPKSKMPHIYLDSGTEDGLISEAKELAQILMVNDVPFDYMQSRGRHNADYWRRSIGHMMSIQHEVMQRALGNRP